MSFPPPHRGAQNGGGNGDFREGGPFAWGFGRAVAASHLSGVGRVWWGGRFIEGLCFWDCGTGLFLRIRGSGAIQAVGHGCEFAVRRGHGLANDCCALVVSADPHNFRCLSLGPFGSSSLWPLWGGSTAPLVWPLAGRVPGAGSIVCFCTSGRISGRCQTIARTRSWAPTGSCTSRSGILRAERTLTP